MKTHLFGPNVLLITAILLNPGQTIYAQDSSNETHASADAAAASPETETTREQTIYVPYSELRDVFEKKGRGVFLPYDEFQRLWNAARAAAEPEPQAGPPVDSIITEILSEATVEKEVVQVDAKLTIEMLKNGWNTVPIRLQGAAIQKATIGEEVARITPAPGGGYQLLFENKTPGPQSVELKLRYARAFEKSPGQNRVSFAAPQAPVNRWRIRIPQQGIKVDVSPMIAASEGEAISSSTDSSSKTVSDQLENESTESEPTETKANETVLLAFVGSASEVAIRWTPKSEGATGMTAITSVQANQEVYLGEGAIRTRANLTYSISRSQLTQLVIDVPEDHKVVNVFHPNVRKWEVVDANDAQRIVVDLFEPATESQTLLVELEKFVDVKQNGNLDTPTIRAVGVGRQSGVVVVAIDPLLRAEATSRTGLLQLDAAELPSSLPKRQWSFAYRYAALPMKLAFAVEEIQPSISVDQIVECTLAPTQVSLDVFIVYDIKQTGVFQFEFNIPSGYEISHVAGRAIEGVNPASVESFHTQGDNEQRLIVDLSRKAIGKTGLRLRLTRRLSDANLLTPTGSSSTMEIPVIEANQEFIDQFEGKIVVYAPDSLRVNPTTTTGLRAIAISKAFSTIPSSREENNSASRPAVSFAYNDQARQLELSVLRRSPYVTARQMLVVNVDHGVVKYESNVVYSVQYSGIKSLRIDLPVSIATEVRSLSSSLRDAELSPLPDDVAEGYTAWSFTGDTELLGEHRLKLVWEQTIEELQVGNSQDFVIPVIVPMDVDRAWGQVVVTKSDSLDVEPESIPDGLRPIDPIHDLMPDFQRTGTARAFEFYDSWNLTLRATRYQLQEVKHTSIERALVRVVVTRSGQLSVQALYRVRSARQRLALKLPADAQFDTQPARINGRPVSLEQGDQDLLYVPLIGQDPEGEFLLELRYSYEGDHRAIAVPELPEDPAMQKVQLAVFLPKELALLDSSGPWTEEFTWRRDSSLRYLPKLERSDSDLAQWVSEGISVADTSAFQTDGRLYIFSAMRPQPPPEGLLRLSAWHEKALAAIVIAVLAIVGALFLRSSLGVKLIVVSGLLIAAVSSGVFAPTLAQQLVSLPTCAGLAVVAIAWVTWSATRTLRKINWGSNNRVAVSTERGSAGEVASDSSSEVANDSNSTSSSDVPDSSRKQGGENE